MTFKDRWSRLFHKSDSSSSSSSSLGRTDNERWGDRKPVSHTPKALHSNPSTSRLSSLASSRMSRIMSWRSSTATNSSSGSSSTASRTSRQRAQNNPGLRSLNLHPSERPLTEQNLRHQEMLGRFTMKVAQRRVPRERPSPGSGEVSPRDSRSLSTEMAMAMRGRTFETAFRDWKIDERGEDEDRAPEVPLRERRITEESI